MYIIRLAGGRLWRYIGEERPTVFFSRIQAENVIVLLRLANAEVMDQDRPA